MITALPATVLASGAISSRLYNLNAVKASLVAAWLALDKVAEIANDEHDKHLREKLTICIGNVEVMRRACGADNRFEVGDHVLVVASIEQGQDGLVEKIDGSCYRINFRSTWALLSPVQIVLLRRRNQTIQEL